MPQIDRNALANTEAKVGGGGGFEQMEPGVYELYIQAVRTEWDTQQGHTDGMKKQCVRLIWDVASGPFEKKYTDAYFVGWDGSPLVDKDFMHSCYLSWKKLEYFKHNINVLNACNPGKFDALAAFEADRWDMFVGKKFWAVLNGEVDLNDNGYDRWKLSVGAWLTPEMVRNGEIPAPQVVDNRGKAKGGGQQAPATYGATLNV
jgi:hypothetical protein